MATTITGTSGHLGLGISPSDIDSIGRSLNIASSTGGAIYLQDTDAPTTKFAAISYSGGTAALQIHAHHSASYIDLGTNGTERLRIDNNGKILIATTTTSEAHANNDELIIGSSSDDANHGLTIVTPSSKYGTVAFSDGSGGKTQGLLEYNHSGDYMRIYTAGSERLRITSDGRTGVGTSPHSSYRFDIRHTSNAYLHLGQGDATLGAMANNTWNALSFQGTNAELGLFKDSSGNFSYIMGTYQGGTDIPVVFRTGNRVERLRIDSSGRVMINTTVEGRATYGEALTIAGSGHCGMTIRSGTTHYGILHFSDGTSGADEYSGMVEYLQGTNRMRLFAGGKYNIVLNGGGSTEINHNEMKRIETTSTGAILTSGSAGTTSCRFGNTANRGLEVNVVNNGNNDAGVVLNAADSENSGYAAYIAFQTGGEEKGRFEGQYDNFRLSNTCSGITFNGDWAAANRLNDYEEGSFNPAVSGASSSGTGSNSAIEGHYTKIGNLVHVDIYINQTSHNGTGQVRISTPFSCKSGAQVVGSVMLDHVDFDSNFRTIASHIWGGSSLIALYGTRDDASWDGIGMSGNLDSSVRYILSITYPVA